MCPIMSWENHNQSNIFGSLNCFYLECIKMNNDEAIVVEHNTTDRIESLYDDIRSVEKRLGTVFYLKFVPNFWFLDSTKIRTVHLKNRATNYF